MLCGVLIEEILFPPRLGAAPSPSRIPATRMTPPHLHSDFAVVSSPCPSMRPHGTRELGGAHFPADWSHPRCP